MRRLATACLLAVSAPALFGQAKLHDLVNRPQPPRLKSKVAAEYTERAAQARLTGKAIVQVTIDKNGVPQDPKFIAFYETGLPDAAVANPLGLDKSAVAAVRKWRFYPATKNLQAVAAQATIEVEFAGPDEAP